MSADTKKPSGTVGVILVIASCVVVARAQQFAGGTGEPDDPYRIATAEQLISIGSDPNLLDKHYILVNDVDLDPNLPGGRVFTHAVIAPDADPAEGYQGIVFAGGFDGNHRVVRNLTIRNDADHLDDDDYLGLFGVLGERAVVKNLGIEAAHVGERYGMCHGALAGRNEGRIVDCHAEGWVEGGQQIGGLAGQNRGDILDCRVIGGLVVGPTSVGGLVGVNHARVVRCHANCEVWITRWMGGGLVGLNGGYIGASHAAGDIIAVGYGVYFVGGLVGQSFGPGAITNCHAAGSIVMGTPGLDYWFGRVGGLAGGVYRSSILNCYATTSISGSSRSDSVGGLVGQIGMRGCIVNAYATGRISAEESSANVGGLVGEWLETSVIGASFWNVETSGLSRSGGGTGLTTADMQDMRTFLAAGWDFIGERSNGLADVWLMPADGGSPVLAILSDGYEPPALAGSGKADDPYRIATPADLGAVWHHDPSACYRLTADIDLSGVTWGIAPIPYLCGEFDGADHTIAHLSIRGPANLGLFAYLDMDAAVTALAVDEADIAGADLARYAGILAGHNDGDIVGCRATGRISVETAGFQAGGLVGTNGVGTVTDCHAVVTVLGGARGGAIGGLAGSNSRGTISASHAVSRIVGGTDSVALGGLVGSNDAEITSSYARGSVSGEDGSDALGGLVGWNRGDVVDCYTHAVVSAGDQSERIGGLVGHHPEGAIVNCYTAATVSAGAASKAVGSFAGTWHPFGTTNCYFVAPPDGSGPPYNGVGIPLTDVQMKQQASFPGWDFVTTWTIREGMDYPRLQWENRPDEN